MSLITEQQRAPYLRASKPVSLSDQMKESGTSIYTTNTHEDDNIYYNVVINHDPVDYSALPLGSPNTEKDMTSEYLVTRDIPLLGRASDFYCAVIRFDIPLTAVPILICPIVPNQPNPNLTPWIVGIQYACGATGST